MEILGQGESTAILLAIWAKNTFTIALAGIIADTGSSEKFNTVQTKSIVSALIIVFGALKLATVAVVGAVVYLSRSSQSDCTDN